MTYPIVFAANAVGLAIATLVAARLAGRVPTRVVIFAGLAARQLREALPRALWFGMPLPVALIGFFVLMTSQGWVWAERRGAGLRGGT